MQATAVMKYARLSPQKGRLVADLIRGVPVARAIGGLEVGQKKAARELRKTLESAIANAEHNEGADVDELRVARVFVDGGPTLKRSHARAKGRGARIIKRTSHITVTVSDEKPAKAASRKRKS